MKIGLHYSFQVAPGERSHEVIRQGLEDIAWADRNGFASVVFAEHHFLEDGWIPRPMQLAAAAAAVTRHVRVGTDIVVLALHHPVAVAEEAAVADNLSGGRFILGVGLGWMQREFAGFGVPFKQRAVIYERSIGIVRRLLRGETVSDDEGHYRFKEARVRPQPVNPNGVPLWMGAIQDVALARVARVGDAWVMPPGASLAELVRQKGILTDAREAAGLPPFGEQPLRREVFVAETDTKAWELYAPGLRHEYGHVYRELYPSFPEDDTIDNIRTWGEDVFVVGAPRTVAAKLRRLQNDAGVTECLARCQLPTIPREAVRESLEGLAEVIRLLRHD